MALPASSAACSTAGGVPTIWAVSYPLTLHRRLGVRRRLSTASATGVSSFLPLIVSTSRVLSPVLGPSIRWPSIVRYVPSGKPSVPMGTHPGDRTGTVGWRSGVFVSVQAQDAGTTNVTSINTFLIVDSSINCWSSCSWPFATRPFGIFVPSLPPFQTDQKHKKEHKRLKRLSPTGLTQLATRPFGPSSRRSRSWRTVAYPHL